MKKYDIIKNNREFDDIISNGKSIMNGDFVIYYRLNLKNHNRFGISVGKKIGNAVVRNYYKRIIRNICDINKKLYSKEKDYIIIVRKGCLEKSFKKIDESFKYLINKIKEKEQNYEETN